MQYELCERIRSLSDEELRAAVNQGEEAYQPGVYGLYLQVYKERGLSDIPESEPAPGEGQNPGASPYPGDSKRPPIGRVVWSFIGGILGLFIVTQAPEIYSALVVGKKIPGDQALILAMKNSPFNRHFSALEEFFPTEFRQEILDSGMMLDSEQLSKNRKDEIAENMIRKIRGRMVARAPGDLVLAYERDFGAFLDRIFLSDPQEACKLLDPKVFGGAQGSTQQAWDQELEPAWRNLLKGAREKSEPLDGVPGEQVLAAFSREFVQSHPWEAQMLSIQKDPQDPGFYRSYYQASKFLYEKLLDLPAQKAGLIFKALYQTRPQN